MAVTCGTQWFANWDKVTDSLALALLAKSRRATRRGRRLSRTTKKAPENRGLFEFSILRGSVLRDDRSAPVEAPHQLAADGLDVLLRVDRGARRGERDRVVDRK